MSRRKEPSSHLPMGGPVLQRRWKELVEYVIANTVHSGRGVSLEDLPGGSGKTANTQNLSGGNISTGSAYPLKVVNASTDSETRVRVIYGTLGGIPATGMSTGDVPPYYVTLSSSGYIYAVMVFTAGDATTDPPTYPAMTWTAEFFSGLQTSDPFAVDGSGTYYFLLASISVTTEGTATTISISPNVLGSQDTQICTDGVSFQLI